jgi:hypothetical protein
MATGALVILAVIPPRTTPKTGGVQTDREANLTSEDDTSRHPMDGREATHNRVGDWGVPIGATRGGEVAGQGLEAMAPQWAVGS